MPDIKGRGRPQKYGPILSATHKDDDWHTIDTEQGGITQVTQLRKRYTGWDFRCVKNDHGKYDMQARWMGGD